MKIIHMLLKDLRVYARDRMALLINLVMPIALVGILGAALGPIFSGGSPGVSQFAVAVVDDDKGPMARQLVDEVLGKELSGTIQVKEMGKAEALEAVKDDVAAALFIPAGFSQAIEQGKAAELSVIANPQSTVSASVVGQVAQSYSVAVSSVAAGTNAVMDALQRAGVRFDPGEVADHSVQRLAAAQNKALHMVAFSQQSSDDDDITAMQYYAAAMLAMFSMFMAMTGVSSILEERENATLYRLYNAGATKGQIMGSKLLSTWLSAFIEALILMYFTQYAFGVDWGNPAGSILVAAVTVFAATGFAMIMAAIAKTSKAVGGLSAVVIQVMSAVGGSMFPLYAFSGFMKTLSQGTINYWSLQGFLNLMGYQPISSIALPAAVLLMVGAVGLGIGTAALRLE